MFLDIVIALLVGAIIAGIALELKDRKDKRDAYRNCPPTVTESESHGCD